MGAYNINTKNTPKKTKIHQDADEIVNTFAVPPEISQVERLRHTLCSMRFLRLTGMIP